MKTPSMTAAIDFDLSLAGRVVGPEDRLVLQFPELLTVKEAEAIQRVVEEVGLEDRVLCIFGDVEVTIVEPDRPKSNIVEPEVYSCSSCGRDVHWDEDGDAADENYSIHCAVSKWHEIDGCDNLRAWRARR